MTKHVYYYYLICIIWFASPQQVYVARSSSQLEPLFVSVTMCNQVYTPLMSSIDILPSIVHTVQKCSYDQLDIKASIFPYTVSLPYCTFDACNYTLWQNDIDHVVDSLLDMTTQPYPYRVYIFPDISTCSWGGLAPIGCLRTSRTCRILIQGTAVISPISYLHEIGHILGLTHSYAMDRTNKVVEYGDSTCAMGLCCDDRCFNAPHSAQLGWVHPRIVSAYTNYILSQNASYIVFQEQHAWIHIHMSANTHIHVYTTPLRNPLGSHVILQTTLASIHDEWVHPSSGTRITLFYKNMTSGITKISIRYAV